MPSHKIHLKIAQEINMKLKLDNDSIMLGSVLPDLTISKSHGESHFQYIDVYPDNLANADAFINKYNVLLSNPISIGYIIHLLTDRYYTNQFYEFFFDFVNGKPHGLKKEYKGLENDKSFKNHLFESYDKYLITNKLVYPFTSTKCIESIPEYQDLKFDYKYLQQYIAKTNIEIMGIEKAPIELQYIDFLNNTYMGCIKYIESYFVANKLMKPNNKEYTRNK